MSSSKMYEEQEYFEEIEDEDGDEGDEELDLDAEDTKCIFCDVTFIGCQATWDHCAKDHDFSLLKLKQHNGLDCFTYIKFINYMRLEKPSVEQTQEFLAAGQTPWHGDEFMKPAVPDDPLLMYDVDEVIGTSVTDFAQTQSKDAEELQAARQEVQQLQERLQEALEDLQKMRVAAQQLVMSSTSQSSQISVASSSDIAGDEDQAYFGSYSHFGIHQEMLQDKARTESYKDSIEKNSDIFKDKVVLDVGCGTGILSMFAARAGAKQVIGVDMSDVIYQAIDVVRENGLDDRITLLRGKIEEIDLPVEQVDIIISEWMGYFLLFESMLDTVIYARDRWLSPEGHVLPNRSSIWLQGLEDQELKERHVTFWNDVYGFKMSSMKTAVLAEASVQTVKADKLVTDVTCIKELDHLTCTVKDLDFTSPFKLRCTRTCDLMAFVAYFLCDFDSMNVKVRLSTSPLEPSTHWKQTVFFLEESLHLESGELLEGQLICRKNPKDPRSLKIVISFKGKSYKYVME